MQMLFDALLCFTLFNCKEPPPQFIPFLSRQVFDKGKKYFSGLFYSYLNTEMTLNSPTEGNTKFLFTHFD